jgi:YVTN family beta-propeller protein
MYVANHLSNDVSVIDGDNDTDWDKPLGVAYN